MSPQKSGVHRQNGLQGQAGSDIGRFGLGGRPKTTNINRHIPAFADRDKIPVAMMKNAHFLALLPSLIWSLPALAAGGAGGEGPSKPGSRLEVAMTLYAGGITMGQMTLDATLRSSEYHSVSTLQTSGVINAF